MDRLKNLLFLTGFQFLFFITLQAWDDTPKCFKYLEKNFFEERILTQALSFHYIPQGDWDAIYRDVKIKMKHMPETIKMKARAMDVNPLENPFQPKEAQKLLLDSLYEAFASVMWYHNIYHSGTIVDIFNFVLKKQQSKLDECFAVPTDANK